MNIFYEIKQRGKKVASSNVDTSVKTTAEIINLCKDHLLNEIQSWIDGVTKIKGYETMEWDDERLNELARALYYYRTGIKLPKKIMEPAKTPAFINAQEMMRLHPDTFECPTIDEINSELKQGVGFHAKVCVGGERFWLMTCLITDDEIYGKIINNCYNFDLHGLKKDEIVIFKKEHIYSISRTE